MDKYQRKTNKAKSWLFEKVNKINKSQLDWPIMEGGGGMRNEREGTTTEDTDIKRIIREYFMQFHATEIDILGEMDTFFEGHKLQNLRRTRKLQKSSLNFKNEIHN